MTEKSCYICKYCASWSHSATRFELEDSGWECTLKNSYYWDESEETQAFQGSDEELAKYFASHCSLYSYVESTPEPEPNDYGLTAEEITEIQAASDKAEYDRLMKLGYLEEETGEPTIDKY